MNSVGTWGSPFKVVSAIKRPQPLILGNTPKELTIEPGVDKLITGKTKITTQTAASPDSKASLLPVVLPAAAPIPGEDKQKPNEDLQNYIIMGAVGLTGLFIIKALFKK